MQPWVTAHQLAFSNTAFLASGDIFFLIPSVIAFKITTAKGEHVLSRISLLSAASIDVPAQRLWFVRGKVARGFRSARTLDGIEYPPSAIAVRRSALSLKIARLRTEATEHTSSYIGHNRQIRKLLCEALLLWIEVSDLPASNAASLESLLKGFSYRRTAGDRPNFNPWIAYIFGFSAQNQTPAERSIKYQRNRAMQGLHAYYMAAPANFVHDAQKKLEVYLDSEGGVEGFLKNFDPHNDAENDPEPDPNPEPDPQPLPDPPPPKSMLQKLMAEVELLRRDGIDADHSGIGTASLTQAIRVDGNSYAVCVTRVADNKAIILGSSNRRDLIEAVMLSAQADSRRNEPLALRALTDAIATQLFPAIAISEKTAAKFYQDVYYEESEVSVDGKKLPTFKRIQIRGPEVLLSMVGLSVSPVTRCVLPADLLPQGERVYLKELPVVEELIEHGVDVVIDATPPDRLKLPAGSSNAYSLQLHNAVAGYKKTLHFRPAEAESDTQYQANFRWSEFQATWTLKVHPAFFVRLLETFLTNWFKGLGHATRIARTANQTLRLAIDHDAVRIFYNDADDQPDIIPFDKPSANWTAPAPSTYLSKDIAPILYNLAHAAIMGEVELAGNEHALLFRYSNEIGTTEIAVPTLADIEARKRDGTMFFGLGKAPELVGRIDTQPLSFGRAI